MDKLEQLESKIGDIARSSKSINEKNIYIEKKLDQILVMLHSREGVTVDKLHEVAEEIILDLSERLENRNKAIEDKLDRLIDILLKLL